MAEKCVRLQTSVYHVTRTILNASALDKNNIISCLNADCLWSSASKVNIQMSGVQLEKNKIAGLYTLGVRAFASH